MRPDGRWLGVDGLERELEVAGKVRGFDDFGGVVCSSQLVQLRAHLIVAPRTARHTHVLESQAVVGRPLGGGVGPVRGCDSWGREEREALGREAKALRRSGASGLRGGLSKLRHSKVRARQCTGVVSRELAGLQLREGTGVAGRSGAPL